MLNHFDFMVLCSVPSVLLHLDFAVGVGQTGKTGSVFRCAYMTDNRKKDSRRMGSKKGLEKGCSLSSPVCTFFFCTPCTAVLHLICIGEIKGIWQGGYSPVGGRLLERITHFSIFNFDCFNF